MSSAAIHHRQRGLTLLEMLVAMTIMALSITVIYRAIAGSARGVCESLALPRSACPGSSRSSGSRRGVTSFRMRCFRCC